jgi:diacylglycerol kinase (ATP)
MTATGFITRSGQELHALFSEASESRVVLVGGDGTIHAAANAPGPIPELALVPTGRANNIARALGIPARLDEAARIAASAPALPLDVLLVESGGEARYCVEGLSAGLQAEARAAYDGENSADLRAGVKAFAGALRRYRPYRVELEADGELVYEGEAAQVFLSNLPYFGFGFRVNPLARSADGLLEAIVLRAGSRIEALRLLAAAYRGRHLDHPGCELRRARSATLTSPLPLTCDATPLGAATATVTVRPGHLRLASPWKR